MSLLGFLLLQTPWYLIRWLCSLFQLKAFLRKGHLPTYQDVVHLIEGTGLSMMLQRLPDSYHNSSTLKFEFSNCKLLLAGRRLQSLSIIYTKESWSDSDAAAADDTAYITGDQR